MDGSHNVILEPLMQCSLAGRFQRLLRLQQKLYLRVRGRTGMRPRIQHGKKLPGGYKWRMGDRRELLPGAIVGK